MDAAKQSQARVHAFIDAWDRGKCDGEGGMKFHIDGTLPTGQQIFVFGSNLAGVHGAAMPLDRIEPHIKVFLDFAASCTDEFL